MASWAGPMMLTLLGGVLVAALVVPAPAAGSSYSYVSLEPGIPDQTNGSTFEVPVFAFYEPGGGPTNRTATAEIAYNLELLYVGTGAASRVNWTVSAVALGSFDLELELTAAQVGATEAGEGIVSLNATLPGTGGGAIAASGEITGTTLLSATAPSTWWETWFGASTPPPDTDSVGGIFAFLAWMDSTTTGRALYMVTTLVAILLYLYEGHKLARSRIVSKKEGT